MSERFPHRFVWIPQDVGQSRHECACGEWTIRPPGDDPGGPCTDAMMEHIEAVEAERDALRRALADVDPLHPLARHLGAWEIDTEPGALGWVSGRCRRNLAGAMVLYAGTLDGVRMWGCKLGAGADVGDSPGTEADADAWARAQGWTLH